MPELDDNFIQRIPRPGDKWRGLTDQELMDIIACLEHCYREGSGFKEPPYEGVLAPLKALLDDADKAMNAPNRARYWADPA